MTLPSRHRIINIVNFVQIMFKLYPPVSKMYMINYNIYLKILRCQMTLVYLNPSRNSLTCGIYCNSRSFHFTFTTAFAIIITKMKTWSWTTNNCKKPDDEVIYRVLYQLCNNCVNIRAFFISSGQPNIWYSACSKSIKKECWHILLS